MTFRNLIGEGKIINESSNIFDFLLNIPSTDYEKIIKAIVKTKNQEELNEIVKGIDSLSWSNSNTKLAYSIVKQYIADNFVDMYSVKTALSKIAVVYKVNEKPGTITFNIGFKKSGKLDDDAEGEKLFNKILKYAPISSLISTPGYKFSAYTPGKRSPGAPYVFKLELKK